MNDEKILKEYGFIKNSDNEYVKGIWTVRLEDINFEIFADPEKDTRYYFGRADNLEKYLKAIQ